MLNNNVWKSANKKMDSSQVSNSQFETQSQKHSNINAKNKNLMAESLSVSHQKTGAGGPEDNVSGSSGRGARMRIFVALFDYDPPAMSPNPEACDEELPFREGQLIKVYGEKDADGFYWGEAGARSGFVPCNMVSEVQVIINNKYSFNERFRLRAF